MKIEDIRREVEELAALVSLWQDDSVPTIIEQDIALSKLTRLYEGVKFMVHGSTEQRLIGENEEDHVAEAAPFIIDMESVSLSENDNLEVHRELKPKHHLTPSVSEVVPEVVEQHDEIVEQHNDVVEEHEETVEEHEPEPIFAESRSEGTLFDLAPIKRPKRKGRRSVFMSLYNDDAVLPLSDVEDHPSVADELFSDVPSTPVEDEKPVERVIVEEVKMVVDVNSSVAPVQTLGDVLASDVETVADHFSAVAPRSLLDERSMYHSFDELGINEKYLLSKELFGDDPIYCNEELRTIGSFDNYDDAMIYIAENYEWSLESDGVKLLLSILENKFNN